MSVCFGNWNDYWEHKDIIEIPERGSFNVYSNRANSPYCIICCHGAGHSALSFSLLAKQLKGMFTFISPDMKCHGDTPGNPSTDLTIDSLSEDFIELCKVLQPKNTHLILIGHSLGGCICARAALVIHISAILTIDTIEGPVLENLPAMKQVLLRRPQKFDDEAQCINYAVSCGEIQNYESAIISASGRFKKDAEGKYIWRTDLLKSEGTWTGWFSHFADNFLKSSAYKVVILPDINRLDTPFTIAHMSGKFQLEVIWGTTHCIHEDKPEEFVRILQRLVARIGSTNVWD